MKDIDFDELDRAVSSVLEPVADKKPAPEEAAPAEVAPAATEPEKAPEVAPAPEAAPAVVETTPAVEPEATAAPAAKTPLAIKRRGQFMDVVHPSSDMTTSKPDDAPAAPTRKVTLAPLSASVVPEDAPESVTPSTEAPAATAMPDPTEAMTPAEVQTPVETVEPAPADVVMPDPLDVMETQEETKDAASAEVSAIEDTTVDPNESLDTNAESAEGEAASATPFLTDTKVDKRPLDAFSPDEAPAELATAAPVVASEPLPPELQADVIAVESNPSERMDEEKEEAGADEKKESSESGFNASIPQQYASTDGAASDDHSIFDTREYHQPLTPAKTKKRGLPGWLVAILVIFLLAGLGAAGGYFWFYYGI